MFPFNYTEVDVALPLFIILISYYDAYHQELNFVM